MEIRILKYIDNQHLNRYLNFLFKFTIHFLYIVYKRLNETHALSRKYNHI